MKIAIFSEQSETLERLSSILNRTHDAVCFSDFSKLQSFYQETPNSVVILETLGALGVVEARILKLKETSPLVKIYIMNPIPNFDEGTYLLRLGICGYSNTFISESSFHNAISFIIKGKTWLYPEFIQRMINITALSGQKQEEKYIGILSARELETATYVAEGMSNKDISLKMNVTARTIKSHITSIFKKLNVSDRLGIAILLNK